VTLDHRLTGLFNGAMLLLAEFLLLNSDEADTTNKLRRAYSTTESKFFAHAFARLVNWCRFSQLSTFCLLLSIKQRTTGVVIITHQSCDCMLNLLVVALRVDPRLYCHHHHRLFSHKNGTIGIDKMHKRTGQKGTECVNNCR